MKEQQAQATAMLIRAQEEKAEERNRIMAEREVISTHSYHEESSGCGLRG